MGQPRTAAALAQIQGAESSERVAVSRVGICFRAKKDSVASVRYLCGTDASITVVITQPHSLGLFTRLPGLPLSLRHSTSTLHVSTQFSSLPGNGSAALGMPRYAEENCIPSQLTSIIIYQ